MKTKYNPKLKNFSDLQLEKERIKMNIHIVGKEMEEEVGKMFAFKEITKRQTLLGMGVFVAKVFVTSMVHKKFKRLKK